MDELEILYFGPKVDKGVGGSARLDNMLDLLKGISKHINIISYSFNRKTVVKKEKVADNVDITMVSIRDSLPKFLKALGILILIVQGLKYILGVDVIFAHGPYMATGFPALILSKIFRKPLVVDHMDINDQNTPKFIYKKVLRNSTVLAISKYLQEECLKLGSPAVLYVPIFIDPHFFQKDEKKGAILREKLGISSDEVVIGYSGSFWKVEGIPVLLEAFQKLVKKHDNLKLMIIGHSNVPHSDDVARIIREHHLEDKVIMVPRQPYHKIPEYLSVFDIACSSKLDCEENRAANPIKIYEYLSMGLLTVVSAVGEITEIIEPGKNGYLVKPGSAHDLEETLDQVLGKLNLSDQIGRNARNTIKDSFTKQNYEKVIYNKLEELT